MEVKAVLVRVGPAAAAGGLVAAVVAGARVAEAVRWLGWPGQKAGASRARLPPLPVGRCLCLRRPPHLWRHQHQRLRRRLQRRRRPRRCLPRRLAVVAHDTWLLCLLTGCGCPCSYMLAVRHSVAAPLSVFARLVLLILALPLVWVGPSGLRPRPDRGVPRA